MKISLITVSYNSASTIQDTIDSGGLPSVWRQIFGYLVLSWGEILVWVTCLEYAYTNSPKYMKSTMAAIGLLTVSLGNYLVALMNESISKGGYFAYLRISGNESAYYWFFVKLMVAEVIIFMLVSKFIKEKRYVGEE